MLFPTTPQSRSEPCPPPSCGCLPALSASQAAFPKGLGSGRDRETPSPGAISCCRKTQTQDLGGFCLGRLMGRGGEQEKGGVAWLPPPLPGRQEAGEGRRWEKAPV